MSHNIQNQHYRHTHLQLNFKLILFKVFILKAVFLSRELTLQVSQVEFESLMGVIEGRVVGFFVSQCLLIGCENINM